MQYTWGLGAHRNFPGVVTVGIALHLGFLLSLRTGWLNPLFNDALHRFGPGCDFFSIYAAGVKARLGEPVYPIGGHVEQVPYAWLNSEQLVGLRAAAETLTTA